METFYGDHRKSDEIRFKYTGCRIRNVPVNVFTYTYFEDLYLHSIVIKLHHTLGRNFSTAEGVQYN